MEHLRTTGVARPDIAHARPRRDAGRRRPGRVRKLPPRLVPLEQSSPAAVGASICRRLLRHQDAQQQSPCDCMGECYGLAEFGVASPAE